MHFLFRNLNNEAWRAKIDQKMEAEEKNWAKQDENRRKKDFAKKLKPEEWRLWIVRRFQSRPDGSVGQRGSEVWPENRRKPELSEVLSNY